MGGGPAVLNRHQGLGARTDDRERRLTRLVGDVQQIHVRAGIGDPQHPVDVKGLRGGVDLEALGRHHLEGLTGFDIADQFLDDRPVFPAIVR